MRYKLHYTHTHAHTHAHTHTHTHTTLHTESVTVLTLTGIVTDGAMATNGLTRSSGIVDTTLLSSYGEEICHLSTGTS